MFIYYEIIQYNIAPVVAPDLITKIEGTLRNNSENNSALCIVCFSVLWDVETN